MIVRPLPYRVRSRPRSDLAVWADVSFNLRYIQCSCGRRPATRWHAEVGDPPPPARDAAEGRAPPARRYASSARAHPPDPARVRTVALCVFIMCN